MRGDNEISKNYNSSNNSIGIFFFFCGSSGKYRTKNNKNKKFSFMHHIITSVEKRGKGIIAITIIIIIFSLSGALRLLVENSFINYFKSTTQIYKSLKTIDQKLGGTTPLDVIVTFKQKKSPTKSISNQILLIWGIVLIVLRRSIKKMPMIRSIGLLPLKCKPYKKYTIILKQIPT